MLVYNIKRAINILGVPELIAKLKNWKSPYKAKTCFVFRQTCFAFILAPLENTLSIAA